MKPIIHHYDGIVATRYEEGDDGTCAMYLVDAQDVDRKRRRAGMMPAKGPDLIGWSGNSYADPKRDAASRLVAILRKYADAIEAQECTPGDDV